MNKKIQPHWALSEIVEEQIPGTTIDLWARISEQTKQQKNISPTNRQSVRPMLHHNTIALLIVLALFGSLACVPKVRAAAETVIQKIGIAFINPEALSQSSTVAATEISANSFSSPSLAEIQQQLSFHLLVPSWMPDGLAYVKREISQYDPGKLQGSGMQAEISYSRTADFQSDGGLLQLIVNDGPIVSPPLLAEGQEQSVSINGQTAYFVHGSWQVNTAGNNQNNTGNLTWNDQEDNSYLTWTQNGISYLLEADHLGLTMEDLVRIATSLK